MNMRAAIRLDRAIGSNPTAPVCGYCNRTRARHEPNDHVFDAVGGSLPAIDPRNGPPPIAHSSRKYGAKSIAIIVLAAGCWYGLIHLANALAPHLHAHL
jgi:hypothetical protein